MSPRLRPGRPPALTHIKKKGIGRVRLGGHDHYLGRAGDWPAPQTDPPPHILEAYNRLVADHLARAAAGITAPSRGAGKTLAGLAVEYVVSLEATPSRAEVARSALTHLARAAPGRTPRTFAPEDFAALLGLIREKAKATVRDYLNAVRAFLRWAGVPREVRAEIADRYPTRGLGRRTAKVPPAPEASVRAVLARGSARLAALVRVQLLTGMRPGEVCRLTPGEIDREADTSGLTPRLWLYEPAKHKKAHLDKARRVWIGPAAQEVLRPWLEGKAAGDPVFPGRSGRIATVKAYRALIETACVATGVEAFAPNRLRHSAGTFLEGNHPKGISAAQGVLGHENPEMTRRYSEALDAIAQDAMRRFG